MFTKMTLFYTGTSNQRTRFTLKGGSWGTTAYPATVCILEHPLHGTILIDTGYSLSMKKHMSNLVHAVYRQVVGAQVVADDLAAHIDPDDVALVILSHFHPDHIGSCNAFSKNQVVCSQAIAELAQAHKFKQLRQGYFAGLFPYINDQLSYIESCPQVEVVGIGTGFDLLGDQSLLALATPGHAVGHYSFLIQTSDGPVLYGVDAAWHQEAISEQRYPSAITKLFIANYQEMIASVHKLETIAKANPQLPIFFCHCTNSHQQLAAFFNERGRTDFAIITNNYL
ncbi:MBL fold metallo-hydrolase [Culicoidibacter larvae]|uniref:MBL fold metallo-hydrolase n=1 Tax=Culicoidibacter larvae TaxID=2579976 RepID=A0A5R8QII6_9FIRM|nr:MBL fold metallo-hydrolase [Culicoidibacter larvae]TLG77253.1 MBL fold metallo-hydrolase [Culicoidibacter larvae]